MSKIKKIELSFKCDEDWDKMSPVDQGRHCAACKKSVIDFSNYSDKQIVSFYETPENASTCGRFRFGQLENLNENLAVSIPKKEYNFLRPIVTTALLTAACSSNHETGEITVQPVKDKIEKQDDSTSFMGKINPLKDSHESRKKDTPLNRTMGEVGVVVDKKIDSIKQRTQVIPEVVISRKSPSLTEFRYVSHTAGVPILTHEEVEIKNSLWKRIGYKIRRVFRRKERI